MKSLKSKVVSILIGVFALTLAINYGIQKYIVYPNFVDLEHEEAQKDLERSLRAIKREIHHLDTICRDWSAWDDTYDFIKSHSKEYIESNLVMGTFTSNDLNIIYFIDNDGKVVWGEIYNLETEKTMKLADFPKGVFQKTHSLISYKAGNKPLSDAVVSGVFMTEQGPLLISSRPILTSDDEGPVRGSLIMGQFLNDKVVKTLVDQTEVDFKVLPIKDDSLPESQGLIEKKGDDHLLVYTTYPDLKGNPALLIKVTIPRKITAKGSIAIRYASISIWISALFVLIIILLLLHQTVLRPITKLTSHVVSIGKIGDLSTRLSIKSRDEIGTLANEFDNMVENLEKNTAELAKANAELKKDITEHKQAEEALRESEEKYHTLVETSQDGVMLVKGEDVLFANSTAIKMFGFEDESEMIGRKFTEFVNPEFRKMMVERGYKREKGEDIPSNYEIKGLRKNGTSFDIEFSVNILTYKGGIARQGIVRDITERKLAEKEKKKLQTQLQKAQKMETIGILAGGVAHDLNNILSGIVSYPELLLMDLPEESPLRKPLLTIKNSGEKAAVIVQDLLTLARRGVTITEIVNLNSMISEQLKGPEYEKLKSFYPNVDIETNLEKALLNIKGSTAHLSKTVMNLIFNAAEAMPDGGKVLISTENLYIDRPIKGYDHIDEGDYVTVTVIDTGIGISKEDINRIFEPFYTKKVMGRSGSGLGMSVVWGTVKDHNGYIDIESTKGKGTTFTLYFPVIREELAIDNSHILIEDYMGKGESILIVDDVEEQREIASVMLKKLGYSVTSVSSGEEAIEYTKDNSVDLLILDMIMDPGIDGLETYKRILKLHPKQKAIIASGFSETDRVKEAKKLGAGAYVKKPYVLEKIGLAIKEELEK